MYKPTRRPICLICCIKTGLNVLISRVNHASLCYFRYIDPTDFIESIGIDTAEQQDAQEFAKLFTTILEEKLSSYRNPLLHGLFSRQFAGEYAYVTR